MHDSYKRKKLKITSFLLFVGLLCSIASKAQNTNQESDTFLIKGLVIDEYNNPIENVILRNSSKDSITSTGEEGRFEFSLEANQDIYFYHSNYYIEKIAVTSKSRLKDLRIRLKERFLREENELNVLYDKIQKDNYLGSASTVYTNELTTTLQQTYVHALPGRLAGLYTEQTRGIRDPQTQANTDLNFFTGAGIPLPGERNIAADNTQFNLNLRGQNPVVVIDGVQRDLSSIDPQNIESISVQKDALSSILLGMRSSRGMLLVTTKEPDSKGFRLSFTQETGMQQSLDLPNPLPAYQYAYLLNEGLQRNGISALYSQSDFNKYKDGSSPYTHPDVNWYDQTLKSSAPMSIYNLNVNGGNEIARYFLSLGYYTQEGFFKSTDLNDYETNQKLDRYLVTTKIDVDVTEEFKVGLSLFGRVEEGNQPGATTNNILSTIYNTPNNAYPVFNPDGSYGGSRPFSRNIWAMVTNSGYIEDTKKDVLATLNLDYDFNKFIEGLSFKALSTISVQNRSAVSRVKQNGVYDFSYNEDGSDSYSTYGTVAAQTNNFISVGDSRYWYGQLALNYEKTFNELHNFEAKILGDQYVVTTNYDLPNRPADIAGSVKYDYNNKYFAEAAINRSYYNGYRSGQQWGTFYAFGLGWDIAKESFLDNVSWLNKLKLRAVYGKTGNGIDNAGYYNWRQSFSSTGIFNENAYQQGYSGSTNQAVIENDPEFGIYNPNISWEKADKLNVGVDVDLFNNHLNITADYYYDQYYDLLQVRGRNIELLGYRYSPENIGENLQKGAEISFTYQNNIGDFNYFVTGNWSQQASEITFMDEQYRPYEYNKRTGNPVNTIYGYIADGFYETPEEIEQSATISSSSLQPGDIKYKDLNGDGVINDFDVTAIGNTDPLTFYGINAGFYYKGFDFNVLLQGVYNRDIYYNSDILQAGFIDTNQSYGQAYAPIFERWIPENADNAAYPGLTPGINAFFNPSPNFSNSSSLFVYSGDYFRVKNITLGYTFPNEVTKALGGIQLRVFAHGTNIFTASSFDLGDPEVISFTSYPNQRVISGGLNLKF